MMSYTKLKYHIVFSVKGRRPLLRPEFKPRLVKYIGGIVRNLHCVLDEADGPEDHIHVAAGIHPSVSVSDFVRDVKCNATSWMKEEFPDLKDFAWQEEYAAFTVSHSQLPAVERYIRGQVRHHKKMSFIDELKLLLQRHEIEFDERYLA